MPLPTHFHGETGYTPNAIRDRMMTRAGLGPEVQAKILRRAVNTAVRGLRAKKPMVVGGEITQHDDNMAQLRASEILIGLTGANPSKDANATVNVKVEISLPDWAKPIDVCTIGSEVCEAEVVEKSST